ncbi:MAG: GerAB/ArcD/ProY family transporter, partial [Bacilli bacterium]|nr:GerAB/ArcD/ProY family transporter [Bacilli bacterium]
TLGKVFGKIILIPFVLFCMFCFIACLLITKIFITLYIFPDTPAWVLILFMIVPITYAAYKGAGVISRLSNFIVPIALFAVLLFFILSLTDMDFSIFQPVLADSTFLEINQGAFFTAARYSEILIYWVFSFFLMKKSNLKKTYAVTLLIFLVSMALMVIPTVSVLGVEYAKRTWNPYYTFTRQIELFHSIERIQTLNLMAWFPCALFKLSIYAFMTSYIVANIFKAKTHKPFVIPTSAFAFAICLLPVMNKSSTIEILRSDQVFPYFILPATFGVPLIILIVFLFRKNKINLILSEQPQNKSDS